MKILSPAISHLARLRYWKVEQWLTQPINAQREVLQDLVTHGQYTEFGRKYGMDKLFSLRKFKQTIPIHEYEDIKPYIERLMQGEQNILWDTPVNWFAKSSGTTGSKSKFIPVTQESLEDCHYQGAKDVLTFYYLFNPESDLLTGKGLVIGGSHNLSQHNENAFYGDLSAVLLQNSPTWSQWLKTPELSIALMDEWEAKIEALAQATIHENVTSISGVPTWTLVLIKRILELTGKSTLKEVWPHLELYIHGGVSFAPYKQQFEKLIGDDIFYLEMYNASEGFFGGQPNPLEEGMYLFLQHGIFYEFMPMEEYGKSSPKTVGLQQVKIGEHYAPVISTNGGLWRYLIGDTIQFTQVFPFKIKVTGRLKHFINAFGEEVIVENADKAISIASQKTGAVICDYTAAPVYFSDTHSGAHEWLIEFEQQPDSLEQFTIELDNALKLVNSDYEAKRHKNIALQKPFIHAVPKGFFHNWLQQNGKLGGQHKVPRLSNNRDLINELLQRLQTIS